MASDLLKDYEAAWWAAARKGDLAVLTAMLAGGREVLAATADENGRTCVAGGGTWLPCSHSTPGPASALHFLCGVGSEAAVQLLLDAGADVSAGVRPPSFFTIFFQTQPTPPAPPLTPPQDKDGFTPLHLAAGYLNRGCLRVLLRAGADPEQADGQGRSALDLLAALKANTPASPEFFARRGALDEVAKELEAHLFEELQPAALLERRRAPPPPGATEGPFEYLVAWPDGQEATWEPERNIADDVLRDYQGGLEYARGTRVVAARRGAVTEYLVEWVLPLAQGCFCHCCWRRHSSYAHLGAGSALKERLS